MMHEHPLRPGGKIPPDFLDSLREASAAVLMLDYDGTLAPFREERDKATPYEGLRPLLRRLMNETDTRLAIVTGRAVADLLPLLDMWPAPEIYGTHGWEHLALGEKTPKLATLAPEQREALDRAQRWIESNGHAARSEHKPASVTLHWRDADPDRADALERSARAAWEPLAAGNAMELHGFDGGLELRATGRDKGDAVRDLLQGAPSGTAAAYLGDDLTDEDAFGALPGDALAVLVRPQWRPSRATAWLRPPEELFRFLETWIEVRNERRVSSHA